MQQAVSKQQGFGIVETLIAASLMLIVFGALFASFKYSLELVQHSKVKLSALSVAQDRMEFFRSLPYADVGTISGIPSGTIPQNSTTSLNGVTFYERVLVEYVDDPADGLNAADSNGIPADYKRVKLEYSWNTTGATSSIQLISNIVPRSIETTAGGGTVRINVIDDQSALLPGASVRLINDTTTSTIDVTRTTDASGAALFSGAPAASNYEVVVTGPIGGNEYSIDQTHVATTSNPNPTVAPFSVLEADISTLTFQIGEVSDLSVRMLGSVVEGSFDESFNDLLSVASSSQVVGNGDLELADTLGVYETSGFAFLGPIAPVPLLNWEVVRVVADLPVNTEYDVRLYTGSGAGPYTLIPEGDLPGNSAGFSSPLIDISQVSTTSYPAIFVGIELRTLDTSVTPEVEEVSVLYRQSETAEPTVTAVVRGDKVIGTDAVAAPIYKFTTTTTTDAAGRLAFTDLEFDTYTFDVTGDGYDIAVGCGVHPFVHQAGVDGELELQLMSNAAHSLRVMVVDTLGRPLPQASVRLTRTAYDVTQTTGSCGQTFFTGGGVGAFADYIVEVDAVGYIQETIDPLEIAGDEVVTVVLHE